jgi:hypothetical protein
MGTSLRLGNCRKTTCANAIPASLSGEQLCLDHFLDEAFLRTGQALEKCRAGQPIDSSRLEWLLTDALTIVNSLDDEPGERSALQRDRMLELLLILANLHEYAAHVSNQTMRPA